MATRKQRRRREKEKRHEYDIVYLDEEGNEVEPPEEPEAERTSSRNGPAKKKPSAPAAQRGGVQPPDWRRSIRRGLIFSPIFAVLVYVLSGSNVRIEGVVFQTVLLFAVFVPFSYFMDRMLWRSSERRAAKRRNRSA